MKFLLVFALCGITCCLAGPACSKSELNKCSVPPGPSGTEEEELDKLCRSTKCSLKVYDRCGTAIFGSLDYPVKGYHRLVDALCTKTAVLILRKKYLENAECIRSVTKGDAMQKMFDMCGIKYKPKEEFCREIPKGFSCAEDYIIGKCGKDAGDVFSIAALPYLDPYDCLSS